MAFILGMGGGSTANPASVSETFPCGPLMPGNATDGPHCSFDRYYMHVCLIRQLNYCCASGCPPLKATLNFTVSENQAVSTSQCNTSPAHRVDRVVECVLWNVGPFLLNGFGKLLDIVRNWNTL